MCIEDLLAGLAAEMPGAVVPGADGIMHFRATEDIDVIIIGTEESDDFMLIADVAPFPQQSAETFAKAVLKANWLFEGTAGATFSICPETGFLTLSQLVRGADLTVDAFQEIVGRLTGLVARWRTLAFRLDRGEGVSAETMSDEHLRLAENNFFV